MTDIILTQYSGKILGPIAKFLGWIMDGIYISMDHLFGIQNIGLSIIILTLIIYGCLFPLTYKQQKFSKLSMKMQPELQAVQAKYKGKKDQASMQKMQEETQRVYEKYGVSPTGSCVQMLIQMPILFALYRVFYNVPAYVGSVKNIFDDSVTGIMATSGFADKMTKFVSDSKITGTFDFSNSDHTVVSNYIVDVLYKMSSSSWTSIKGVFSNMDSVFDATQKSLNHVNYFLGLNIGDTPWNILTSSFKAGTYLMVAGALIIPIVSYLSQVLNIKLMPTAANAGNDQMAQQMKMMNTMMPLFSFFMCFTVPVGLGIYWIAGAVVRSIQQYFLNKHMEKIDLDDIIKKNQEKAKKKREKRGIAENQITNAARMSTKANTNLSKEVTFAEKEKMLEEAKAKRENAKTGSMASKANMVKDFNEKNNK